MSFYDFTEVACARRGCGEIIVAHAGVVDRWKRTHETFHCPAGHPQHFAKATAEERYIEELERRIRDLTDDVEWWAEQFSTALSCPWGWCPRSGYRYGSQQTFLRHLEKYHGLPEQVEPEEVGAA